MSGVNVQGALAGSAPRAAVKTSSRPSAALSQARIAEAAALRAEGVARRSERASRARSAAHEIEQQQVALEVAAHEAARAAAAAAARAAAEPDWVKPVLSYSVSAGFGESSGLWSHRHTGQDFAAPVGTPVRAVGEAKVLSAENDGAYGNKVVLAHKDGTLTWYCHLSAFAVKPGEQVKAGDVIGKIGTTGNTTGPHLHLEVRPTPDKPVEPLAWLRKHGVKI